MKQIGNWVFGSFFRTIGRLLVFIMLGFIIANMVDFGSLIDGFRITDLFFEKVDALTLDGELKEGIHLYNGAKTQVIDSSISCGGFNNSCYAGYSISFDYTYSNPNKRHYLVIPYRAGGYYESGDDNEFQLPSIYKVGINWSSGASFCELQNNYIVCSLEPTNNSYNHIHLWVRLPARTKYYVELNDWAYFYESKMDNQTNAINNNTNAITNQTQQQQQQHQETMNSSTTDAENEADGFFGNFTVSDTGGLNAIITAPLNTIQSLLSSSCTNLVLPLPFVNKNLTLPCMNSIYNDHFGVFFTLYQTIILAIISYRCLRSLFFDIKGFSNPEDDRIEVMDL